jgi:hypothetical protein
MEIVVLLIYMNFFVTFIHKRLMYSSDIIIFIFNKDLSFQKKIEIYILNISYKAKETEN